MSRIYRRSFDGTKDGRALLFYFTMTVLFCWHRFWIAVGQDFLVNYPITYFVLYVSLFLLARMSGL